MDIAQHRQERVAVVTGAGRGLGLALATALAQHGLQVVLTARRLADAEKAAGDLTRAGLPVRPGELDVTDPVSVFRLFTDIEVGYGRLDVLVNNAAVAIDRHQDPSRSDIETMARTFEINLFGAVRCCQHAVRLMRRGGYGRVTNVSSRMGSLAATDRPASPAYGASKAALNHYTRTLAAETRDQGILVNAASPGTVKTRLNYGSPRYTAAEAAGRMLWLSLLPDDGPTGGFFDGPDALAW